MHTNTNPLNIEWLKCHHGVDKRSHCAQCESEKSQFFKQAFEQSLEAPKRIPILRGCSAIGGCFCSGACREIVGYRDPLFPGERQ